MRLELEDLDCSGLEIESPGETGTIRVRFADISDGSGSFEFGKDESLLRSVAIRELVLSVLELPIAGGSMVAQAPAKIGSATMDGKIAGGLLGQLHFGYVGCESLGLNLQDIHVDTEIHGEEVNLNLEPDASKIYVGNLTLQNVVTQLSGFQVSLGTLSFTGLKVGWSKSGWTIEALKAHAQGLRLTRDAVEISISGLDLSEGFQLVDDQVSVAQILIGKAEVSVVDLAPKDEKQPAEEEELILPSVTIPPVVSESLPAQFDPGILDTINGQLDVDLTLDINLPVLGRRRATHHFRVALAGGILNYRELERDLSDLEDAFIDIKLRGRTLVVERNIPLLPGLEKPIILWDLGEGDVELAKQHLVRLRTLPRYRLASASKEASDKKSKVKVRHLDLDPIAIELSIDDAPVLRSGDGVMRLSLDQLSVAGGVRYRPSEAPQEGRLAIQCKGLAAVASEISVANRNLSGEIRLGSIEESHVEFLGPRPDRVFVQLKNLQLKSFAAELVPGARKGTDHNTGIQEN